jgi:hypothetical protein
LAVEHPSAGVLPNKVGELDCKASVPSSGASSPLIAGVYGLAGNATTVKPGYEHAPPSGAF